MSKTETPHLKSRFQKRALRYLTLIALEVATSRCFRKLFPQSPGGVIFFFNLCIKVGKSSSLAEAHTLQFIAKNTSIPVPAVYHTFTHCGRSYILMERIQGKSIANSWRLLSDSSKASIFSQLKPMIEELRAIPSQSMGVCNLDGGPIYDCRLPNTSLWGPFDTLHDFHLALRNGFTSEVLDKSLQVRTETSLSLDEISEMQKLVAFHESVTPTLVFTHGDLSSLNILIRDDKVVAIIDWETAGWLPYYWEYSTAWHANPQNYFWQNQVGNFLNAYETELEMEKIRHKYFGDIPDF